MSLAENLAKLQQQRVASARRNRSVIDSIVSIAAQQQQSAANAGTGGARSTYSPSADPTGSGTAYSGAATRALASNTGGNARAVDLAKQSLGVPYRWGGNDLRTGVDCSGLVQQVYKKLGINLPRTAAQQARAGQIISGATAQPGDLVSFSGGRVRGGADHIGIYAGNGMMVVAPHTGDHVKIQKVAALGETPTFTRIPSSHPAKVVNHVVRKAR